MINLTTHFGVALGVYVGGPAEAIRGEIGVVYVQIQQAAAGFFAIKKTILSPSRGFPHATKARTERYAKAPVIDCILYPFPFRPKAQAHGRHEKSFGSLGSLGDLFSLLAGASHRFFAQHMLAAGERGEGLFVMQKRRRGDIDQVNAVIGQQIIKAAVGGDAGHVQLHGLVAAHVAVHI